MLVLNNSYELAETYLQVFLLWMFCSELVLSCPCVYFDVTGHFIPVLRSQSYARTSHPLKKVRLEKSGSLYLGHSQGVLKSISGSAGEGHMWRQKVKGVCLSLLYPYSNQVLANG